MLGGEASWDDPLSSHAEFLRDFVRTQAVQTNEPQRSWILLPCFLRASELLGADELDVVELGPSAGLNLVWDRYRYTYAEGGWGHEGSRLVLTGEEESPVPARVLARVPSVRRRIGIDLTPIDVTTDEGARLLECFVWAGQDERMERLSRAIEVLRSSPPQLVQGDLAEELPSLLEARPTLVFQTAVFPYLAPETRDGVRAALEHARAPVAFVTAGRPRDRETGWGMRIELYPGAKREFVGHADFHGAWLDYAL